jgi:hypothetical protein
MRRNRSRHLFSDDQLRDIMELRLRQIFDEIDSLKPNYILNANIDDLCNYFQKKYQFEMPVLNVNGVCFEQDEADIDVSQDFHRAIFDRSQPFYMKGTRITFVIPFEVVSSHVNFKRQADYANETGFQFVLSQKNDPNRELIMTVLVFEVPVQLVKEKANGAV